MGLFQKYSKNVHLGNRINRPYKLDKEAEMPINKKKIRREITVNGARIWVTADTEQEYADKITRLSGNTERPTRSQHNFTQYAYRWFNVFSWPNVEEVTAITYKRQLDLHILPVIGDKAIEDVTVQDVQEIFNAMGEYASQQTKNKCKMVLNQIFKMAVEDRIIPFNPLSSTSLRIKGPSAVSIEPYSVAEMRYFAAHLDDLTVDDDRAWFALSICLPLRPEEVLGLRWQDIDEENLIVKVRSTVSHPDRNMGVFKPYTKTDSSQRDLAIPARILGYLPERGRPLEFVIGGCSPASYTKIRRMRERIARTIGYDGTITPRRFRTTVATDISATTHDLKLVQRMLGHATPQMTLKHYDKGRSTAVDATDAIGKCYGF